MNNTANISDGDSLEYFGRALRSPTYSICYVKRKYTVRRDSCPGASGELVIDAPKPVIGQLPEEKDNLKALGGRVFQKLPLPTPIVAGKKRERTRIISFLFGALYFIFAMYLLFSVISGIESSADIGLNNNITADLPEYRADNQALSEYEGKTYVRLLCKSLGIDTLISSPITTVDNFLSGLDYGFDGDDIISCDRSSLISEGMEISVSVVDYSDVYENATVPYETENVYTTELRVGAAVVQREGADGTERRLIRNKYVDGELTESTLLRYEVTKAPVDSIVKRGCRGFVEVDGIEYPYSYCLDVEATAYGGPAFEGAHTSTGKTVDEGMIAVDPTVIALGKQVYITGYNDYNKYDGFYSCEDTGGVIVGNMIDIYTGSDISDATQFGRRQMKVYVLETPEQK